MDENQKDLMSQLQILQFACIDFNLYIDTHPEDKKAIEKYNELADQVAGIRQEYEKAYGPLTNFGTSRINSASWVQGPWPWENEAN